MYTIWGRSRCLSRDSQTVYTGRMGSSVHNETGGASNYLCLPNSPQYRPAQPRALDPGSGLVGGVELSSPERTPPPYLSCAVCYIPRPTVLMIPAMTNCSLVNGTWTTEYSGYLMSQTSSQTRTEFVCVSEMPDRINGDEMAAAGGQLYFVEAQCENGLNCGTGNDYQERRELSCAVCSRGIVGG